MIRVGRLAVSIVSVALSLWAVQPTWAQDSPDARLSVSLGPDWMGRAAMGGQRPTLTGSGQAPLRLFEVESNLRGGIGVGATVGVRVARRLWTEVTGRYHSARLSAQVTRDIEAQDATVTEALQQLQIEGGVFWLPERLHVSRVQGTLLAGAGYLRQLHGSNTLSESGHSYYLGAGAVVPLPTRQGGTFKASAVRIDVRAAMLDGGVAFDDAVHVAPGVRVALFLRF